VQTKKRPLIAEGMLWALFFLICAGLGYPGLNRYDPRQALPDAAVYTQVATQGPAAVESQFRFRVLVPLLSRAVFLVARDHTGTWDALMFSFLVVNAAFVATTAYLLCRVGTLLAGRSIALLGAALYLLNFAIANLQLATLVDAGEACLLMSIIASLFYRRHFLLPAIGVVGALAKESFVPFSIVMTSAWWLASGERRSKRALTWTVVMVVVEAITLTVLQSAIAAHMVWPWSFALDMSSRTNYATNLLHSLVDRNSWYILVWLLPLGMAGIRRFPRAWRWSIGMASVTAVILNAYHSTVSGGGGGIGRYIFNVAGPLLSLSAAAFLSGLESRESHVSIAID
jgi:hypothetical protein